MNKTEILQLQRKKNHKSLWVFFFGGEGSTFSCLGSPGSRPLCAEQDRRSDWAQQSLKNAISHFLERAGVPLTFFLCLVFCFIFTITHQHIVWGEKKTMN